MVLLLLLLLLCGPEYAATPPAEFAEHLIASGLKGGYQVVIADLNKDGKPDIIALASGMTDDRRRNGAHHTIDRLAIAEIAPVEVGE